jgi:hypothetical protein
MHLTRVKIRRKKGSLIRMHKREADMQNTVTARCTNKQINNGIHSQTETASGRAAKQAHTLESCRV